MTAYVIHDPADESGSTAIAKRARTRDGWIAPRIWPGTRDSRMQCADTILEALGKDTAQAEKGWTATVRWQLLEVWLMAERITDVVLIGSNFLHGNHCRRLAELSDRPGRPRLWLLEQDRYVPRTRRDLIRRTSGLAWAPLDQLVTAVQSAPKRARRRERRGAPFPAVPGDDVPFFIPECRRVLSRADFTTVARTYTAAARAGQRLLDRSPDASDSEIGAFLRDLVGTVPSDHEAMVRLRGAQRGMLERDRLLKVHPEKISAAYRVQPAGELSDEVVDLLRGFVKPAVAAAAAIVLAGALDPPELTALRVDDIERASDTYVVHAKRSRVAIPPCAASLLRAQLLWVDRSDGSHQFLANPATGQCVSTVTVRRWLNTVARETGLNVGSRLQPPRSGGPTWRLARGFSFQAI